MIRITELEVGDLIVWDHYSKRKGKTFYYIHRISEVNKFKITVEPISSGIRHGHYFTEEFLNSFPDNIIIDNSKISDFEIKLKYPEYFI